MKIIVDAAVCEAHGECVLAAPELFDLGETGVSQVLVDEVPQELQRKARMVEGVCPAAAIRIEE